ncbi:MAG: IS1595 family transposase [Acidobacteriota bacterium]|nr:IS1595 family transposase [Acidobacteriota bacterium]
MEGFKTLREAVVHFANFENCKKVMVQLRWPNGKITCPHCGSDKIIYLSKNRVWKCYGKHPRPKFSLKTGTIFEDSPLGLDKWLPALWLVVNCKNGISSCETARDLGVTQKTAWFMNHRIRFSLTDGGAGLLSGEVEADETFIGGKARNMHAWKRAQKITGTGGKDKTAVMGIVERGGKIRTSVVPNRKKKALQAEVRKHVEAGSALYTDALKSYEGLGEFQHQVIDHAVSYVDGKVHTNNCENFWSLLKRGLNGTYVSVEPFHLFRYLDEQSFRYNNRKELNDYDRFELALSQITGKRLTYEHLTGKDREPDTAVI